MSWNIESLGDAKATVTDPVTNAINQSELMNFVNLVIRKVNADIIGIMEVKSGIGASILGWLLPRLNNSAGPGPWKGRVSARQDGGTQEETLYLWKEKPNTLALDLAGVPAPISAIGIVDKNALERTFASLNIANQPATQDALLTALNAAKYIGHGTYQGRGNKRLLTRTWRVNADQWNALNTAKKPAAVNFGATHPPVVMGNAQLQALAAQLIGTDILRFVGYGDRSPFLANFLVGSPPKKVMVGVLHAPGPQDPLRTDAVNVIGLSRCATAAAADNLVLMGDFNIAANQGGLNGVEYGRFPRSDGSFAFAQLVPRQYQPVFDPIENAPLRAGAMALPPPARTTLIDTWVGDTAPSKSVLGNTYDKFFFRGNATKAMGLTARNPLAWNMIERLNGADAVNFWPTEAQSALAFFRAFRGDPYLAKADAGLAKKEAKAQKTFNQATNAAANIQAKINAMNPKPPLNSQLHNRLADENAKATKANQQLAAFKLQRAAIKDVRSLVNGAGTAATGTGTALAIYREAISDHLPISLDLDT